jgi:hypothetical protein
VEDWDDELEVEEVVDVDEDVEPSELTLFETVVASEVTPF